MALKRLLPPAVLALLALGYMWIAQGFSDDSAEAPMLYGAVLLILSLLSLALALLPAAGPPSIESAELRWRPALLIFSLIAGFVALAFLVGFYIAIPVFLCLFLKFQSRVSWRNAAIFAGASFGFVWLVFSRFLHLTVFAGYWGI